MAQKQAMRPDQFATHLVVDGIDWGADGVDNIWDTMEGGDLDSETTTYPPGGMVPEITIGGQATTSDITLTRFYSRERDHARLNQLITKAGKGRCKVIQQPLDPDGNIVGPPLVYLGTLKGVNPPKPDSTVKDRPAMIAVVVTIEGLPHVG